MTAEKVSLGEKLYIDKRPSTDLAVSHGACHDPAAALAWGRKRPRNAPAVLNSMINERSVYNVSGQGHADGIRQTLKILSG
jgi:cytochrome c peroxidase